MDKKCIEEIKKAILLYNTLNKKEKDVIDYKILEIWKLTYNDFATKCASDDEIVKLYEFMENYKEVTKFDIKDHYTFCYYTVNQYDPDMSDDEYIFDYRIFNNAKNIYENLEDIEAKFEAKINSLQTGKFVYNREKRIEKLKKQLETFKNIATRYGELQEKEDLKKMYLSDRADEFEASKKRFSELCEKYAREILEKVIKENPGIAVVEHKRSMSYSKYLDDKTDKRLYNYDYKAFNEVCNEFRNEALKIIEQEKNSIFDTKEPENGILGNNFF